MEYTVYRSKRRTLAVQIKRDGQVIVRAPLSMSTTRINAFLTEKRNWIEKHLAEIKKAAILPRYSDGELSKFKALAKEILPLRAAFFAKIIGVTYGKIAVRAEKTVWGSCTIKGNLNFNCLLVNLPQEIIDYVVIHELCHLVYMNHSRLFWQTVSTYCPNYKELRQWLKRHGGEYINRL